MKCCKMVASQGSWRRFQCSRKGIVEHEGKLYCKQHSPEEKEKRRKKSDEKYNRENAVRIAQWKKREMFDELVVALCELLDSYEAQMKNEYDYPGEPWTPERDGDLVAIRAHTVIAKAKGLNDV